MMDALDNKRSRKRTWVLIGTWFSTIVALGLLKRTFDRQQRG